MNKKNFILIVFYFLVSSAALAEYRVFVLKITKKPTSQQPSATQSSTQSSASREPSSNPKKDSDSSSPENLSPLESTRYVTTTLDPEQYRGYYTVANDETVTYIETWRCFGRTDGFKPLCPNPKKTGPTSNLDSTPTAENSTP